MPVPGGGSVLVRGRDILSSVLDDAKNEVGLASARTVLIGGCSAGGLAAFLHADAIHAALPLAATVKVVADAGFFVDASTVTGVLRHRELVLYEASMFNVSAGTANARCAAEFPDELWRCLLAQYVLPHVSTPTFVMQSQYDTYQLQNYFAPTWLSNVSSHWSVCIRSPSQCDMGERRALRVEWLPQMVGALRSSGALSQPDGHPAARGAFAHSCFLHCGLGPEEFPKLTAGGVTLRRAISDWFHEVGSPAGGGFIHQEGPWPGNPFCPVSSCEPTTQPSDNHQLGQNSPRPP